MILENNVIVDRAQAALEDLVEQRIFELSEGKDFEEIEMPKSAKFNITLCGVCV